MKLFYLFLTSFFLLTPAAFVKAQDTGTSYTGVAYKKHPVANSLRLDIFLPGKNIPNRKLPVLIMIHGGAWVGGDRSLDSFYLTQSLKKMLLEKGIAVVSIDYSLCNDTVHFPQPVADCRDAVRWVRANADRYHFDPDNIGLWGASAGAHLALLVGYTDEHKWPGTPQLAAYSSRVNYVVDCFGPTSINELFNGKRFLFFIAKLLYPKLPSMRQKIIQAFTGYSPKSDKQKVSMIAEEFSPLTYISPGAVPTLIFHGTKDVVVSEKQSRKLYAALQQNRAESQLVIIEKGDHGFLNMSKEQVDSVAIQTVNYIGAQVKK